MSRISGDAQQGTVLRTLRDGFGKNAHILLFFGAFSLIAGVLVGSIGVHLF